MKTIQFQPVTALHTLMLGKLDLAIGRKILNGDAAPLTPEGVIEALYFFSQPASSVRREFLVTGKEGFTDKVYAFAEDITPQELPALEQALADHLRVAFAKTGAAVAATAPAAPAPMDSDRYFENGVWQPVAKPAAPAPEASKAPTAEAIA
jgi:hypothetical protein